MDGRLKFVPVVALVGLITIRVFNPDFLDTSPFEKPYLAWIKWWWIVLLPTMYLTALAFTPFYVHTINTFARIGIVPPLLFIGFALGLLWGLDAIWNELVDPWCDPCGRSHLLLSITNAIDGE